MLQKVSLLDMVLPIVIVGWIILAIYAQLRKMTVKEAWQQIVGLFKEEEEK